MKRFKRFIKTKRPLYFEDNRAAARKDRRLSAAIVDTRTRSAARVSCRRLGRFEIISEVFGCDQPLIGVILWVSGDHVARFR